MTTTVTVLIQGNKACEVSVEPTDGNPPSTVKPGEFTQRYIHGDQHLVVKEVGEFLT